MNRLVMFIEKDNVETIEIFPISDDISIQTESKFSSLGELAGSIQNMAGLLALYQGSSGKLSTGMAQLRNVLNLQRYESTEPLRLTTEIILFVKENAKADVTDKINLLLRLHLPYYDKTINKVLIPGVTGYNINETTKVNGKGSDKAKLSAQKTQKNQKVNTNIQDPASLSSVNTVFSFGIPGIFFAPYGFLSSIEVTYSKHTTVKGYPIWARAQIQLSSIGACLFNNFEWGAEKFIISPVGIANNSVVKPFSSPQSPQSSQNILKPI